jgi:hypothetical protein
MTFPPTLLELGCALALLGLGILVADGWHARRRRRRGLRFDPRCGR